MTAVERAEREVDRARRQVAIDASSSRSVTVALDALVRAVEARCAERILATFGRRTVIAATQAAALIHPDTQEQK